jgi:hypothetical protein
LLAEAPGANKSGVKAVESLDPIHRVTEEHSGE